MRGAGKSLSFLTFATCLSLSSSSSFLTCLFFPLLDNSDCCHPRCTALPRPLLHGHESLLVTALFMSESQFSSKETERKRKVFFVQKTQVLIFFSEKNLMFGVGLS